jgi:nucleotide-binding universal stress UspA family protein
MFERILVAVDESDEAGYAVEAAAQLAEELAAEVGLVHVLDTREGIRGELGLPLDEFRDAARSGALKFLTRLGETIPLPWRPEYLVREGEPAAEILAAAEQYGADLIVIGATGRGRLAEFLLGSTAEDVIRRAGCPVMAVRHRPRPLRPVAAREEESTR